MSLNRFIGTGTDYKPQVGDGATILRWSDRDAATIVEVSKSGKAIKVQADHAKRVDDGGPWTESQTYEYSPNPQGYVSTYTLRQNGQWVLKGDALKGGQRIALGQRNKYRDPSF